MTLSVFSRTLSGASGAKPLWFRMTSTLRKRDPGVDGGSSSSWLSIKALLLLRPGFVSQPSHCVSTCVLPKQKLRERLACGGLFGK